MSTKTIYVCEYCEKRADKEPIIRISGEDVVNSQLARGGWRIFVGSSTPKRSSSYGQDAHLCSKECLLLWLGFSVEPASASAKDSKP